MRARTRSRIARATATSLVATSAFVLGAAAPSGAIGLAPDVLTDSVDVNPGNGICADSSGSCSLRAAVMEANALVGSDTITLAASATYTLTIGGIVEDLGATGDLDVIGDLTIAGAGSTIDASNLGDRVVENLTGTLSLSDVTLTGGEAPQAQPIPENWGGAILSYTPLSLARVTATQNTATTGGAVLSVGTTTITDSRLDNNTAAENGGAVATNAPLSISGSTFDNNSALYLSAVWSLGDLTIDRSTFSRNTADGGTIAAQGTSSTVTNTTIADNTAKILAGLVNANFESTATMSVRDTTIAHNTVTGGIVNGDPWLPEAASAFNAGTNVGSSMTLTNTVVDGVGGTNCSAIAQPTSGGHNLDSTGDCGLDDATDVTGPADIRPLADNGGSTQTALPGPDSPAIDAGDASCPPTDQTGATRPRDGDLDGVAACDIGATEAIFGGIAGTVTEQGAGPLAGVEVCATSPAATMRCTTTAANGSYTIDGLEPADHTISFDPSAVSAALSTEWWDDTSAATADPVAVGAESITPGIDAVLSDRRPVVTSAAPPNGNVGISYTHTFTATGDGPIAFTVTGGTAPTGLALDPSTGVVSGLPTSEGTFVFDVTATNPFGSTTVPVTVVIGPPIPPAITLVGRPPNAMEDFWYSFAIPYTGSLPMAWAVTGGSLPTGLTLDSATGVVSGIPTQPKAYVTVITATNAAGTATVEISWQVDSSNP